MTRGQSPEHSPVHAHPAHPPAHRRVHARLGHPGHRVLAMLVALEVLLLIAEPLLVRSLGQQAIAAAMLTAPTGAPALLGLAAVLARIGARALVPAAIALVLGALVARRLTSRRASARGAAASG